MFFKERYKLYLLTLNRIFHILLINGKLSILQFSEIINLHSSMSGALRKHSCFDIPMPILKKLTSDLMLC